MATHTAVVTVSLHGPLETRQVPTIPPSSNEVRVRVQWTASTPFDLHQNDGGLLVTHPQVLGDGTAGTVVEVGPDVRRLKVGNQVFGFTWRNQQEKSHQEYVTCPEFLLGLIPENSTPQEAVTLGNNFVTVFHAVTADLGLPLPWPVPKTAPARADDAILIWGGSSSVGQYALQVLRHWGYKNLLATASPQHHELLKSYGATHVFDYRSSDITASILSATSEAGIPLILDCIGSSSGSLVPIAKFAKRGSVVAALLPVVVKDSTETEMPVYSMDVQDQADWEKGVDVRGVRTHFYLDNEILKEKLQSEIMPTLLAEGIVKPNKVKIVEGKTLLERAQNAMDALRRKEQSGERLVWRIAEE